MEVTPLCIRLDGTYLSIKPNKLQFFEYDSITFKCEGFTRAAEWRVIKKTPSKTTKWQSSTGTLNITTAYLLDRGEYWCENEEEEKSNAVNIIVTDADVILESPALPVTEEANVTLRCKEKTGSLKRAAHFFKDGQLINTVYNGEMTIYRVSEYDEGLYKCRISETGESSESWLVVRAVQAKTFPSSAPTCHIYLLLRTVFTILMVALLLLLVGLFHCRKLHSNK